MKNEIFESKEQMNKFLDEHKDVKPISVETIYKDYDTGLPNFSKEGTFIIKDKAYIQIWHNDGN